MEIDPEQTNFPSKSTSKDEKKRWGTLYKPMPMTLPEIQSSAVPEIQPAVVLEMQPSAVPEIQPAVPEIPPEVSVKKSTKNAAIEFIVVLPFVMALVGHTVKHLHDRENPEGFDIFRDNDHRLETAIATNLGATIFALVAMGLRWSENRRNQEDEPSKRVAIFGVATFLAAAVVFGAFYYAGQFGNIVADNLMKENNAASRESARAGINAAIAFILALTLVGIQSGFFNLLVHFSKNLAAYLSKRIAPSSTNNFPAGSEVPTKNFSILKVAQVTFAIFLILESNQPLADLNHSFGTQAGSLDELWTNIVGTTMAGATGALIPSGINAGFHALHGRFMPSPRRNTANPTEETPLMPRFSSKQQSNS